MARLGTEAPATVREVVSAGRLAAGGLLASGVDPTGIGGALTLLIVLFVAAAYQAWRLLSKQRSPAS